MKKCCVDGCDSPMYYKESGLCTACYQGLWYWQKKGVTLAMKHRRKLIKLENRMELITPNVKMLRRKKA